MVFSGFGCAGSLLPCGLSPSCSKRGLLSSCGALASNSVASLVAQGFPGGSDGKESACSAGALGSILGSGRSPGEGNGYPLQYSFLGNLMDRGVWWATVHGIAESDMT